MPENDDDLDLAKWEKAGERLRQRYPRRYAAALAHLRRAVDLVIVIADSERDPLPPELTEKH